MMNQLIKELKVGDKPIVTLKFSNIVIKKNNNGEEFASIVGFDGDSRIDVKIWGLNPTQKTMLKNGEIYDCMGVIKDYQNKLQFNVSAFTKTTEEINRSNFYEKAPLSKEFLKEEIYRYIEGLEQPTLKAIAYYLVHSNEEKYFTQPAAVSIHQNYTSGLAYHVYSMLKLAEPYLALYTYLNKDLVIAGIIVHDIGKLEELSDDITMEYTLSGNLLGHIVLGVSMVKMAVKTLGLEENDATLALEHIVLSHHGLKEYGSPKEPAISEAEVVHLVDFADSRMAALVRDMKETVPGHFTPALNSFERRQFYVPILDQDNPEEEKEDKNEETSIEA